MTDGPLGIIAQEQVEVLYTQLLALRRQSGKYAGNKVVEILESESPCDEIAKKALRDPLRSFSRGFTFSLISLDQFVGPELFFCGLPEREKIFTCAYTDRKASYLKRFKFGGTILNKVYLCIPDKSRILFFAPDTPKLLYIRYKPAPHQKISQQTCNPSKIEIKSPKTRGRQISIKEVAAINSKPPRGWDPEATTTKLEFL